MIFSRHTKPPEVGDNHVLLLLKAFLAYFDSIAAAIPGVTLARNFINPEGTVLLVSKSLKQVRSTRSGAVVNVTGLTRDCQEFWAYCCFERPPVFARKIGQGSSATTPFSHYDTDTSSGASMICLCDQDVYSLNRKPAFFGRPVDILGHISQYVDRNNLHQQANEAAQIAMLWPVLCRLGAEVRLPVPLHGSDWRDNLFQQTKEPANSALHSLRCSSPLLSMISTLAAESAVQSQVHDYVVLISDSTSDHLAAEQIMRASTWLQVHCNGAGVAWQFLLRRNFELSPSFFYLTGLVDEVVDWLPILQSLDHEYPAYLQLLHSYSVQSSSRGQLPWHQDWIPQIELHAGLLHCSSFDLRRLVHLCIVCQSCSATFSKAVQDTGIVTGVICASDQVRTISAKENGIRVRASLCSKMAPDPDESSVHSLFDVSTAPELGRLGGLLNNYRLHDIEDDALKAEISLDDISGPSAQSLQAAQLRVEAVKIRLAQESQATLDQAKKKLSALSTEKYSQTASAEAEDQVVYSPGHTEDSALWALLYLLRIKRRDQHTLASLKQSVGMSLSAENQVLSVTDVAGLCAMLQLPVAVVADELLTLSLKTESDGSDVMFNKFRLRRHQDRWVVCFDGPAEECPVPDQRNLPGLSEAGLCSSNAPSADIGPSVQRSKLANANLTTRARLLDDAVRQYDWGFATAQEVIELHRELFPQAGVPRFLLQGTRSAARPVSDARTVSIPGGDQLIRDYVDCRIRRESSHFPIASKVLAFQLRHLESADLCRERWPYRSPQHEPKNNVTLYSLLQLLDCAHAQEYLALWFAMSHQGNHSEYVAAVVVWLAGLDLCTLAWTELLETGLLEANEDSWLKHSKAWHERWRKGGLQRCSCDGCWAQLLYVQTLWGRGGVEVDWTQEITNKAKAPEPILAFTGSVWSSGYATEIIGDTIFEVLSTARERLRLASFDSFMDDAYEWLVSGSAAGLPSAFKGTDVRDRLLHEYKLYPRPTKRSVMEKIPRKMILEQLQGRPQIVAKLHQKLNETGGKARAIYGVTIWHYIFSNWLMAPFELAIDHQSIDINLRSDQFVALQARRAQGAARQECFSSYDYPDFNSMHSHHHMSLVYDKAQQIAHASGTVVGWTREETDCLARGYQWLSDSVFTQVCFLKEAEDFIQTVGGLYSGNRDTTLINTLLNVAYARVVDISCRNMKLDPRVDWRLWHGDDIITQHGSYGAALAWNRVAAKANLKGQEEKLLTDRSYHEYLRVMGCADGKLRGSVTRAIASFVNGNWETEQIPGIHGKVAELETSLCTLGRRGLKAGFLARLRHSAFERISRYFDGSAGDAPTIKSLLRSIELAGDPSTETLSLSPLPTASEQVVVLRQKDEIERMFSSLPDEVTRPYVRRLTAALPPGLEPPANFAAKLKMMLQRSTYGTELPLRYQLETEQIPQLQHIAHTARVTHSNRGKLVRRVTLADASDLLSHERLLPRTMRRLQAATILLSVLGHTEKHNQLSLLAHLCDVSEENAYDALQALQLSATDWRRFLRPSAPELCGLENQLETVMTSRGVIAQDEEVVVLAEIGDGEVVSVRSFMLY
ncbi:unnamed protein product [Jaminaea pallidilutea]